MDTELSAWAVLIIFVLRQAAEIGYKLIPDDKTGWLAGVRNVLKVIAAYARNRKDERDRA